MYKGDNISKPNTSATRKQQSHSF